MRVTEQTSCLCVCLCLPCQANARLCDVVRTKELGCCLSALHNSTTSSHARNGRRASLRRIQTHGWHDTPGVAAMMTFPQRPHPCAGEHVLQLPNLGAGPTNLHSVFCGVIRTVRNFTVKSPFKNSGQRATAPVSLSHTSRGTKCPTASSGCHKNLADRAIVWPHTLVYSRAHLEALHRS
jgi:hypothetical protein